MTNETLNELLTQYQHALIAYNAGTPFLTDPEFDQLWKTIHNLAPENPILYHTTHDSNDRELAPHPWTLPGLQKAFSVEDLKPFIERFRDQPCIVQPKYDGMAVMLYHSPGGYKMILSGDGTKGRDISHHLNKIQLGSVIDNLTKGSSGELVIPNSHWRSEYGANPRNVVSGWIARQSLPYAFKVRFIPHDFENSNTLQKELKLTNYSLNDLHNLFLATYNEWSSIYPMDGLVIKLADQMLRTKVGHTSYYHWSIAWKPPIQVASTVVTDIKWNVSRLGRVVPKIQFAPVNLCGTINTYATANNALWLLDRQIAIGTKITVGKAGEIIPQILTWENPAHMQLSTHLPTTCPACGGHLDMIDTHLVCLNIECFAAKVKSIAYFYSAAGIEIKSIGEGFIQKLISDSDMLKDLLFEKPWALLAPENYNIIFEIGRIHGKLITQKYLDNLDMASGSKDPSYFVAGLGLPRLARVTALKIWQHVRYGGTTLKKIDSEAMTSFLSAIYSWQLAQADLDGEFTFLDLPEPSGIKYVITGTLSIGRDEMITYLNTYGWQYQNQASSTTNFILQGEINKESTKMKAAKKFNIPVIFEHQLHNYLRKDDQNDSGKTGDDETNC